MKAEQSRLLRHIGERTVPIVSQQRIRMGSRSFQPRPAQHQYIGISVVIVVSVNQVQPTDDSSQTYRRRAVRERAVSIVPEKSDLVSQPPGGYHQIQQTVSIEVFHHATAGKAHNVEPGRWRRVPESPDIVIGIKCLRGDNPRFGHTARVLSNGHIRHVQQPPRRQVARIPVEDGRIGVNSGP